MTAKFGDLIIVINSSDHILGMICKVIETGSDCVLVADPRGTFWIRHNNYEVLESFCKAKVGDEIIITDINFGLSYYLGKFKVIEVSDCGTVSAAIVPDGAYGTSGFFAKLGSYHIIKRESSKSKKLCSECNGTGKITLLTFTVDCDCNEN